MANLKHAQIQMAESRGNGHHDHKLVPDTNVGFRHSDQRSTSQDTIQGSSHHTGGRGSEHSATEEVANEDDEDDSSGSHDDEDDEEDDPEVPALSHGPGKGKGKHPAIRVEPAGHDDICYEEDEKLTHGTGHIPIKHPINQLLMKNKKRTFSDLSSTSILFGDDSTDQESFPRRKTARRLSNLTSTPLLMYKESENDVQARDLENAIESDDDDYSGVNLIPDDDSDMEMMEQEESYILQEEQQATTLLNDYRDARRLSLDSCTGDIFDVTVPVGQGFVSTLSDFGLGQSLEPEALPASPDRAAKRKYSDSSTKRVRFDDEVQVSDSSSSESSELDSNVFPDLFLEQDKLPLALHQLLEMDNDEVNGELASPMSDSSFWDFGQDEPRLASTDQSEDADDDSSTDSSGYDSDMGDTTDEEDFGSDVPPRTPAQKESILRRPTSAAGSRATSPKPFQRSSRPNNRQIPPSRGIFIHDDSSKAIAVTNRTTKTVTFYRPRPPTISMPWFSHAYHSSTSSTANNSPRTSFAHMNASDSEVSNEIFHNVLGTDIMLAGIFGSAPGTDLFFGTESIGPPEAFYPFISIGSNGNIDIMEDDEDDSDDYENDLNIAEFMDFGSEADDTDVEPEGQDTDILATPKAATQLSNGFLPMHTSPTTGSHGNRKRSTSDAMLEHFDRGVVTAFRNNQSRYRDVASLPSDPAARASVSRPVRSGKSAEALMSPLRKRTRSTRGSRMSQNHSSPLAGVTKASSRLQSTMMNSPQNRVPRMGTFS